MRFPIMLRSTHDTVLEATKTMAQAAISGEYERAVTEGRKQVHAFMRDANYGVMNHPRPDVAIRAVFQQAEREFGPPRRTLSEYLYAPANVEEAIDRAE